MTLCTCVMAWGTTVRTAGTFGELISALSAAEDGDEIQLTADINGDDVQTINVTKSITIDGQGHTLANGGASSVMRINRKVADPEAVEVTIQNIKIAPRSGKYGIASNSTLGKLTVKDCEIIGGTHGILIAGPAPSPASKLIIKDTHINVGDGGYPIRFMCPLEITMDNCHTEGYCGIYFSRAADGFTGSAGPRGTTVVANNCNFDAPNVHNGEWNAFGVFVCEDDGIAITLNNCGINSKQIGDQNQEVLVLSQWAEEDRRTEAVSLTITGDNSYIDGVLLGNAWASGYTADWEGGSAVGDEGAPIPNPYPLSITISGGTYAFNPETTFWYKNETLEGEEKEADANKGHIVIPSGYEVKTIETQQGDKTTTLYRVRKTITTSESINDDVEDQGNGQNAHTEFLISADETVEQPSTIAYYVEVSDDAILTLPAGKKLEVTNGLDVTDGAVIDVKAGSTLIVGEGGVTAKNAESIVIEANENGAASFLLDPEVIVNTTPNLTVRMTAKQIGRNAEGDFYWHRFALPVAAPATWEKEGNLLPADPGYTVKYPTYVYAWDYENNAWDNIAPTEMIPLQGYTLTLASDYIHVDGDGKVVSEDTDGGNLNALQDVTYIFKGNLLGNTDQALTFKAEGFNFFGNSFTGYMDVKSMLQGLASENVDGTVYMWCNDPANTEQYQTYVGTSLHRILSGKGLKVWQKEVAPMQTFILRLRGADSANESVNYAASIWGNPRYGNGGASLAPRRRIAEINEELYLEISVKAANGKGDVMDFTEANANTDAFESGFDVEKYMNQNSINLYATVDGMNLSSVVTNNIAGKTLSLKTNGEIAYTMSFKNVDSNEYAIRDNVTNQVIAIEEGATYEFAAQPNSVIEGRFEIVSRAQMPTAIENTEVKANVKGIYTIMGQYLGEDFDILPAGVYVVDGVKIVK